MKRKRVYLIIGLFIVISAAIWILYDNAEYKKGTDDFNNMIQRNMAEQFNNIFIGYEGTGLTADKIKSLITAIVSSNATNPEKKVGISSSSFGGGVDSNSETREFGKYQIIVNPSSLYTVHFSYDKTGFINSVLITEDKSP